MQVHGPGRARFGMLTCRLIGAEPLKMLLNTFIPNYISVPEQKKKKTNGVEKVWVEMHFNDYVLWNQNQNT